MKSRQSALWIAALVAAPLGLVAPTAAAQAPWKPEKTVEIAVGSSPGGGNDRTARILQRIWQDSKWLENVVVVNKVGGGGAVAYAYTSQHPGDAHYLAVARLGFLTNHILGRSAVNYTDMTPLALMGSEPTAFAVRADSPIRTVADLVERLKADPQSVSISLGSTRGSTTHFALARVAKLAGIDARRLKVLTFGGSAQSVTNVMGGHVDMMSASVDAVVPHHKSGKLRIIGVATAERSAEIPDVPTLKEQGYDVVIGGWLALIGPGGLTPAQVAYWEGLLERTANDARWKRYLGDGSVEWHFLPSQPTRDYLKREYETAHALLTELGLKK
jgi:putative tricarboxylic transport membrane protein